MTQLLDKLAIGDTVLFKGPKGRFTYATNSKRAIGGCRPRVGCVSANVRVGGCRLGCTPNSNRAIGGCFLGLWVGVDVGVSGGMQVPGRLCPPCPPFCPTLRHYTQPHRA